MSQLRFYLFGAPRLEREGEAIKISLRKAQALLAYLAVTPQSHSRDALATLFWPDDSQSKAWGNLRRTLFRLNKSLGKGWLEIDRGNAGLNPKADLWLDVDQFQRRLAQCQTHGHASTEVCPHCLPDLTAAAELYTGDFLAGFSLPDCPNFDEWQFFQSEGLRQALASALERLVRGHSDRGNHDLAIPYARRWLALDPLHEPAHRRLMELYAQTGQRAAALRQYEECVRVLDEELGIPPAAETTALFELVKTKRAPPRPSPKAKKAPPSSRPAAPQHNLPPQPTPFIGREDELAEITGRLTDPTCRLLTLVGPGGIGKTRLALAAAERQLDPVRFPNGVYFVSLAPVSGAEFMISTLADALNVSFFGQTEPKAHLLNYLREKQMLLVLDNFEHLLADQGTQLLTDIMRTAFQVKLLVTSCERLHLQEEWVIDLQGLPFPDETSHEPPDSFSAVQLFLQRARQARSDFVLAKDESLYVRRICRLVVGMPLALELAAAWVRLMSCREIAQEIERNLDFLSTPLRNVPDRHRSLTTVFDHSWHHLSPDEQRVFRGLTVFRGGFSREAAEQVAGASLPLLAALVDKSMLRRNDSGRYELHELLRQYGAEKLREAGEAELVRSRHLAYYLQLAERAESKLRSAEQLLWLSRLEIEHDDLRAALAWSLESEATEEGLRLAGALSEFWRQRGYLREGSEWLERMLASNRGAEPVRAKAVLQAGHLAGYQGNYQQALNWGEHSLALSRRIDDKRGIAQSLGLMGIIAYWQEDSDRGVSLLKESLTLFRELEDELNIATTLLYLGDLRLRQGDYEQANVIQTESLALCQKLGDKWGLAFAQGALGDIARLQGNYQRAVTHLQQGLAIRKELYNTIGVPYNLEALAMTAVEQGQTERAVRLWAAAETLRETVHVPLPSSYHADYAPYLKAARTALGEEAFTTAWSEGQAMTLEQAIDYALAIDPDYFDLEEPLSPPQNVVLPASPKLPTQSTPFIGREDELAQITRRLTDPDCRLLTLVGPGGIGKTRLAVEAGARLLPGETFRGGIYFIPLTALSSSDFLVSTLAESLNLTFQRNEDPKVQLLDFLGKVKQAMLLVLDNFEQLLTSQKEKEHDGTELLLDILQAAPAVKLLVTSRERLNLREEWLLDIRGLPFPPSLQPGEALEGYSAVQLFLETALRLEAAFALSEADKPHLVRICQLVEGMPLGLELAAVWVRVLPCREIAQEIEKNLEFLTTSLRDVPVRHRSLIAVFDHSWHHLSPEEQRVFRSLAVFRGGFTRKAAEQVAQASLRLLAALVDKSMLRRNATGRYELHELLRQYGAEKLDEAGETEQVRDRHLAFFLELAEEVEPKLRGAEQARWMEKLDIENGNLRAALSWSLAGDDREMGLRLVAALGQFWHMRGHLFSEGIEWLEKVLSRTGESAATALQAKTLRWLGRLTYLQGDDAKSHSAYAKSLALYRELQDKEGIADALFSLGNIVGIQGDEVAARSFYAETRSFCEESLAILREGDDKWRMAASLNILGEIARVTGDYAAARSYYEESLVIRRALGDQRGTAISLINLGFVANYQGDYRQAAIFFAESLALFQKHGGKRGIVDCVAGLGRVTGGIAQPERAARLLGAAQAQREALHFRLEYPDRIEYDRDVAAVRTQLDEAAFAAAWVEGQTMTLEQAVDYALATEADQSGVDVGSTNQENDRLNFR